jgi:hypothetical protein
VAPDPNTGNRVYIEVKLRSLSIVRLTVISRLFHARQHLQTLLRPLYESLRQGNVMIFHHDNRQSCDYSDGWATFRLRKIRRLANAFLDSSLACLLNRLSTIQQKPERYFQRSQYRQSPVIIDDRSADWPCASSQTVGVICAKYCLKVQALHSDTYLKSLSGI